MKKTILITILAMSFFLTMLFLPISNYVQGRNQNNVETTYVEAEYWWYESIEELTASATEIVRVEVLDERTALHNRSLCVEYPSYEIVTINRLLVIEIFAGNVQPGEVIEVVQTGGRLGNEEIINKDKVTFAFGDDLVLFMESWRYIDGRPSVLISPRQGVYHINENSEPIALPRNDLTLTRAMLEQIQQDSGIDSIILSPEEIESARIAALNETTNLGLVIGIATGIVGLFTWIVFIWKRKKKKDKE